MQTSTLLGSKESYKGKRFNWCRTVSHWWEGNVFLTVSVLYCCCRELFNLFLKIIFLQGTTIQAFISANRIHLFQDSLKTNSVYKLKRFVVGLSRKRYTVTDNKFNVSFTNQTVFEEVTKELPSIDVQKFRTRVYETFFRIADKKEDLFGKLFRCCTIKFT